MSDIVPGVVSVADVVAGLAAECVPVTEGDLLILALSHLMLGIG